MSAIRTLTPNPALDLSARTAKVEPTHKLRCSDLQRHAGGGGINVARMLHRLGVDVRAHYLAGGVAGAQLTALLAQEGVPAQCQPIAGETRENLSVLDKASGQEKGAVFMPAEQSGSPMTYMAGGRQYIVLAIGGRAFSSQFIAFRLPGGEPAPSRRRPV